MANYDLRFEKRPEMSYLLFKYILKKSDVAFVICVLLGAKCTHTKPFCTRVIRSNPRRWRCHSVCNTRASCPHLGFCREQQIYNITTATNPSFHMFLFLWCKCSYNSNAMSILTRQSGDRKFRKSGADEITWAFLWCFYCQGWATTHRNLLSV